MSKKTVFSNPTANESHSRNAFDRSLELNLNFSNGMLIPTFCQFFFGKSHVKLNQRSFFRTADLNTAAFPALPLYTDYFFVPMHQLLTNWNAFRSRTNDRFSARLGNISRLPTFSDESFSQMIYDNRTAEDDAGCRWVNGALRLADMLGYGKTNWDYRILNEAGDVEGFPYVGAQTPLKACAYQKVYYDHYRNTAYEANNVDAYNLDDMYSLSQGNETVVSDISAQYLKDMFSLRYVNYRRDVFNTIYPSLNFISSAAHGLQGQNTIPASVLGMGYITSAGVSGAYAANNPVIASNGMGVAPAASDGGAVQFAFNLQNIRAAFALEKLLRVSAFTPQHVKDQFAARFGYTPKSATMHESVRIGSFKSTIICGEVTSTAQTDASEVGGRLGSIGGKGVGTGDYEKTVSYDVPEDGFIIAVSYILPRATYDSRRVDPINQQFVPEDWSLPEYENLGLQPLFVKNLVTTSHNSTHHGSQTKEIDLRIANRILGYQPRDMQYKASVSENHGEFNKGRQLEKFVLHGHWDVFDYMSDPTLALPDGVNYKYFKARPSDLFTLFANNDTEGNEVYDQFFGNIVIQCGVIQDKPILGIPKL